jgi:hypothetical protein
MIQLDPAELFARLARDLPARLHEHLIVVGSLAAAYAFRVQLENRGVKTKDADLVVHPAGDLASCAAMAEALRDLRWTQHPDHPGVTSKDVPTDKLPAIRLFPPGSKDYFVEFLNLPEKGQAETKKWTRITVKGEFFGLPSFRFQGLTAYRPLRSAEGIYHASPATMALANLLSHPTLGTIRMKGLIEGREILRSAKDLGRVLALAQLSTRDEVEAWLEPWQKSLMESFPEEWRDLALRAGDGLKELLGSPSALEEAGHTCAVGLLAGRNVTVENLRGIGKQLIVDVLEPLADTARR